MDQVLGETLPEGAPPLSIVGSTAVITAAKPLSEDLDKVVLKSDMGSIKPPPAQDLGIPVGTSVGIQARFNEV